MAFGVSPEEEAAAAAAFEEEERKRRASAPPSPILGELTAAASEPVTLTGLRQASMGGPPAVAESPKPPPAPNGPTVTSRAGGMSVDVPVPAGQDVVQTTGTGGKSRSYVEPTKEEAKLREERDKEDQNAIEAQEKRNAHAVQVAEDARIAAEQKAAILAKAEDDQRKELEAYNAEVARREGNAQQETDNHAKALADWQGARKTFWSRQDTGDKIGAGISLILGIFGGVNDGRNVGAERIEQAIEADSERYKETLEQRKQILERSRGDVKEAKADIDRRIKLLDLRTASALDRAAAEAEARGKRLGISEAELAGNEAINKLKQGAIDRRMKYREGLRAQVSNEQKWSKVTTSAGAGGPGGEKDARLKASSEDLAGVNTASEMLKQIGEADALIAAKPGAYREVRKNNMDWKQSEAWDKIPGARQVRAVGQGAGVFAVAPEQNLKSPEAKSIHRVISGLTESLAKLKGGVITGSDREATQNELALAAVAEPEEARRLLRSAARRIENGLRLTVANRQISIPDGVLPGSSPQPASGGSVAIGTRKQTSSGKTFVMTVQGWRVEQ